ncbi:MAG TPA: peroxidase family protein [Pilimelia sp.]|nr:peroxidase family protein [Pilimelia sp.]
MKTRRPWVAAALSVTLGLGLTPTLPTAASAAAPVGQGFNLNPSDLKFILAQIKIAEAHAAGGELLGSGPNQIPNEGKQGVELPWGLRTVDGSLNNLQPGRSRVGAADNAFPRASEPDFRPAEPWAADPDGPGPVRVGDPTSYAQKKGLVNDSEPRVISNLIVDQTSGNPAAVAAAGPGAEADASGSLFIPNTAPDVGLSAPYNSWFTLFGQFFDHGLDLTNKGGGTVFMPLREDDPLYDAASPTNFMVLTRSTNRPGPDGVVGDNPATPGVDESADDVQDATNQTTSFVDQSQTYTSHPSHQVFLRHYAPDAAGKPVSSGHMLSGADGGLATWDSAQAQAASQLGIRLTDGDAVNVPLLATDPYGRFLRGPNGYPQLVRPGNVLVEGNPTANGGEGVAVPADTVRTGHAFLDDIAHHAVPGSWDHDRNPGTPKVAQTADADPGTGDDNLPGTYDDEMLGRHFVTGDGRANENIGLSAVHQIFHSEHNRLVEDIKNVLTTEDPASLPEWRLGADAWNGERLFQAARFVAEMEYQHLAFEEFARKVQPQVNLFAGYDTSIDPAIMAEFAHTVYRFGHSMLNETVDRTNADGSTNNIELLDAFLNPTAYTDGGTAGTLTPEQAAGAIVRGMARQTGNEMDEFVTEALRNRLLGLPLDLATLNIARGRETGMPTLNAARRQFFDATANSALRPYESWNDFGVGIRHHESLVNFVAAYGTHPSITGNLAARRSAAALLVAGDPTNAATPADAEAFMSGTDAWASDANGVTKTGMDKVDFWVGGLAEKQMPFGGLLGSTFNFIFETQMENLQDGDRFYYLTRTAGLNLLVQLEGNSFAEMIQRNTDATGLPADVFSRPDYVFDLAKLGTSGPVLDDPATDYNEATLLTRMPNGTIRYAGDKHVVFVGTPAGDKVLSSEGDDTLRGSDGDDRLEGGAGNDGIIGGLGNDIMIDTFGDDVLKGGDGHDALSSGAGFDLNQPGRGNDFVVGGSDPTETFGGSGNDMIYAGESSDIVFGDDGDDWIQGGGQADLLQGDNGAPFQDDPNTPGDDVLTGEGGADDYDAEGGNDVMVAGPGVERNEGMQGFDWVTHKGDPQAADADLNLTGLVNPAIDTLRDRFDLVEGLSGWDRNDVLRGDDADAAAMVGNELTNPAAIAKVAGLGDLLGNATSFTGGNIVLGGGGDDLLEGRGGDDVLDGDAWLNVRLSVRTNPADPASEIRSANSMRELQADVLAGRINPGNIVIVREIAQAAGGGTDSAVFSDVRANYTITRTAEGFTVTHVGGTAADGTDRVRNVERLVFADSAVTVAAPGAPTIGTATAGVASAVVRWTPPANTGGSPIEEYEVQVFAGTATTPVRTLIAPAGTTSLTVLGLSNGVSYTFRVLARNELGGPGPLSAASNAVVPSPGAPSAPTIGVPTAGNASAVVRWTAPAVDGGSPITGYDVRVFVGNSTTVLRTVPAPAGATSLTVTGLTNGTAYTFRVVARNAVGAGPQSALSQPVTPATVPGAPVIGLASSGVLGGAVNATARWNPPASTGGAPITGYRVAALRIAANGAVLSTTLSPVLPATARSHVFGLPAGSYRFIVNATNSAGTGASSARSNLVAAR